MNLVVGFILTYIALELTWHFTACKIQDRQIKPCLFKQVKTALVVASPIRYSSSIVAGKGGTAIILMLMLILVMTLALGTGVMAVATPVEEASSFTESIKQCKAFAKPDHLSLLNQSDIIALGPVNETAISPINQTRLRAFPNFSFEFRYSCRWMELGRGIYEPPGMVGQPPDAAEPGRGSKSGYTGQQSTRRSSVK